MDRAGKLQRCSEKGSSKAILGFSGGSDGKASLCSAGDQGSIPGLGRSPGEGNGSPLQYSCLENSMDGAAWWATVHGVAKSRTRLSNFTTLQYCVDFLTYIDIHQPRVYMCPPS